MYAICATVTVPRQLGSYACAEACLAKGIDKSDYKSLRYDVGSLTDVVMYLYTLIDSFISCTDPETKTLNTLNTTTTTIIIIVARYQQNLTSATSFIVGPMESIQLMIIVVVSTSSLATKMAHYTPIRMVDGKQMHHVGVGLSLPESLWGVRVK